MSVEVCSYRLTLKGKPAGSHVLKTQSLGRVMQLEGRAQYQGALGSTTIVQRSRCHATRHFSLRFREETTDRGGQHAFDMTFDAQEGVVVAGRGPRDQATIPYIRPYRDPLSMLLDLRSADGDAPLRLPMIGKDVIAQRASEVELDTALGRRRAAAYLLHPGGSAVYVDLDPPHLVLKMTQRLTDGYVEALLVRVAQEAEMEAWGGPASEAPGGEAGDGGTRRKRSRRRRSRRGKRRS